ncbi:hypothetical protein P12x_001696 [Tundrisphaera lichenicola]|uniref:hypothetical protein n=1 Tax=Tundrisphaera lichenicola TaxID=2029860 RepID=UPI003EBFDA2A
MRAHDQTDNLRRRIASIWLLAFVALLDSPARGAGSPVATWKGDPVESIRFIADRIQTWNEDGADWYLLEDRAEIAQGDVSIRADRAVARVRRAGRVDGTIHRVEMYVEGKVHDPGAPGTELPEIRTELTTRAKVEYAPRIANGIHSLGKAPTALPILARAFPSQPEETAPLPIPTPAPVPVEAPGRAVEETSASLATEAGPIAPVLGVIPTMAATQPPSGPGSSAMPFGSGSPSESPPARDPEVQQAQAIDPPAFPEDFSAQPVPDEVPSTDLPPLSPDLPPLAPETVPIGPSNEAPVFDPPSELLPLPDSAPRPSGENAGSFAPVVPGSQRITTIYPRGLGEIKPEILSVLPDGTQTVIIRNGVNIQTRSKEQGIIDIEADNVVLWLRNEGKVGNPSFDINSQLVENTKQPLEFYLEGHVIVRQDQLIYQGRSDQRTYHAARAYYDVRMDQLLVLDAQVELFAPGLITPTKINSPRILQYHPMVAGPDGRVAPSTLVALQAENTVTTGSRFANPGYRFRSRSIDVKQVVDSQAVPEAGDKPFDRDDLTWQIDARQNFFFFGPVPFFYYPRLFVEADDIDPPLSGISFATNNFFGQQFRTDYDVFNLLNLRHLPQIDAWNLDVDYLSARDKQFGQGIALGSEIGWYGKDLINDIRDPFHKQKKLTPSALSSYAGYFDVYGLFDGSRDVLGGGPAVITNSPNNNAAGRAGFTRLSNPTYQEFRGKLLGRHMQSLLGADARLDEDFRINAEVGFTSDRNFLEQYFKRQFDTGLDLENLIYLIRQKENQALTVLAETNVQTWQTESQWYPKVDYYRLGDSLLGNRLTYFQHTGVDYANVHTAAEVNNKTLFAFLPIDPISNTNGTFQSGRLYTTHELDAPLNFNFLRVTPYLQGQAVGWNNQIGGHSVGRIWGAAGARADITLWKAFPNAESELLNVHGLNHKIDFVADYRDSYSNVPLNSIGIQDDLDDNAYEYSRRYFALTNYVGGVLPAQYDPRFLTLRRAMSPITGSTDVQASLQTVKLGIHQRLQTKRGQEGRRHITDFMVFDLDTTYFPQAARDNFNKPFGQNFYNYEWYLGDRTSFVSYGWFEFFKIGGNQAFVTPSNGTNDPFGLRIITSGISITRIPKGNIFVGYTVVNTGPINTSALNAQYSYWMSPKWFMTLGESYDFGNGILLGATGSITRIGADYLTSVGLAVSPLQNSYMFQFEISPRLSPNLRLGSAQGLTKLDSRFAPVE